MKNKMAACHGLGFHSSPPPIGRSVDRVFEDAQFTGEIYLNGRKLRDYPKICGKYDLSDTVIVDISRNRLTEVPHEICEYLHVESVNCYHNIIRSIPEAIQQLHILTHLNLSRNQLSVLPPALCLLKSLEVLSASNNKLVSLPEEIGHLEGLMDLDVSCNEISHLPVQIGDLSALRCLNLRSNFLIELPLEMCRLQLYRLDFSSNRIERIPTAFRKMESLEQFILDHNPMSSPPAHVCMKGRQHIMKYLHMEAIKEDRKRGILINGDSDVKRFVRKSLPPHQSSEEFRNILGVQEAKWKRHTVLSATDSGYSTADGGERNGWHLSEELKTPNTDLPDATSGTGEAILQQHNGEEDQEKEERRRVALRLQEEQKKHEVKLLEVKKRQELTNDRTEEEEERWRREEGILRLQEAVRTNQERHQQSHTEHLPDSESKIPDRSSVLNNYTYQHHYSSSSRSAAQGADGSLHHPLVHPVQPPPVSRLPQPPSYLPVLSVAGPASHSSHSSLSSSTSSSYISSPPQQQDDSGCILSENEYRSVLSSQTSKEQRKLPTGVQYRRPSSGLAKRSGQPAESLPAGESQNWVNRNGATDVSQQSSTSTTPSVSPGPSPRNSLSHLAKPSSPSGSISHLAKPSSPSGSVSHLAKPTGTKSSVPRATNGPATSTSAQSQAVRRTKLLGDRSNTSSPITVKPAKIISTAHLRTQPPAFNPAPASARVNNSSSVSEEESKLRKGITSPLEMSRLKPRLDEQNKKVPQLISSTVKKTAQPDSGEVNRRVSARPPLNMYGSGRGRPGPKATEEPSSNFTLHRREEHLREEAEQIDKLRQIIESRLRVTLPDNLSEALRDGVVLCHLANQIRPRSVGSIHVPSPAVPKLTLAKCRRNVDNFLEACKKIGVEQEHICGAQDVLEERGILQVAATVSALLATGSNPKQTTV